MHRPTLLFKKKKKKKEAVPVMAPALEVCLSQWHLQLESCLQTKNVGRIDSDFQSLYLVCC